MGTKIEWATDTWQPIVGCSKVSTGCANCYAERMAFRHTHMRPGCEYCDVMDGKRWNGSTAFVPSQLDKPLHWRKPRRIFVCSMGDLFHETVPRDWVFSVLGIVAACPQHTFLFLTKRPEQMLAVMTTENVQAFVEHERRTHVPYPLQRNTAHNAWGRWPLPNLHLGVTAENQEQADKRIPILLKIPAAVRFVSVEPMLGPISLTSAGNILATGDHLDMRGYMLGPDDGKSLLFHTRGEALTRSGLDHVICGGESGPGARPMHPDWARSLRDQCVASHTPFLFKQWGAYMRMRWQRTMPHGGDYRVFTDGQRAKITSQGQLAANMDGAVLMRRVGKKAAGRELDGRTWDQYPEAKGVRHDDKR